MFLRTIVFLYCTFFISCMATKKSKIEIAPKNNTTFISERALLTLKKDGTWYSWNGKRENTGLYRKYHDGTTELCTHDNQLLLNVKIENNKLTNTDTGESSYESKRIILSKEDAPDLKFVAKSSQSSTNSSSVANHSQTQGSSSNQEGSPTTPSTYGESISNNAPISNEKMESLIKQKIERKIPIGWGKALGTKSDVVISKVIITRVGTPDQHSGSFSVMARVIGTYKLFLAISQKMQPKTLNREAKFRMYKDDFGDWKTQHRY